MSRKQHPTPKDPQFLYAHNLSDLLTSIGEDDFFPGYYPDILIAAAHFLTTKEEAPAIKTLLEKSLFHLFDTLPKLPDKKMEEGRTRLEAASAIVFKAIFTMPPKDRDHMFSKSLTSMLDALALMSYEDTCPPPSHFTLEQRETIFSSQRERLNSDQIKDRDHMPSKSLTSMLEALTLMPYRDTRPPPSHFTPEQRETIFSPQREMLSPDQIAAVSDIKPMLARTYLLSLRSENSHTKALTNQLAGTLKGWAGKEEKHLFDIPLTSKALVARFPSISTFLTPEKPAEEAEASRSPSPS